MDRVTMLTEALRREVNAYAGEWIGMNGQPSLLYYTENLQEQIYCVVAPYDPALKKADLVIMTRVVNDQIIIDQDRTDKPLFEALLQTGIPREQIIRAYLGEN